MDTKQLITGSPKEGFYPIVQDTVTVIELNEAVINLTSESSSEDIIAAFDSVEDFTTLLQNVRNTENIVNGVLVNDSSLVGKIFCNIIAHSTQETLYIDGVFTNQYFNITITNIDGTFSCVKNVVYLNREVGDKTNVLILSLENDLANGQKDSPVTAEVSAALKDAISTGKACVIKSVNSDILANLQQISDNVTIVMEQISRVGQTFVAVNTTITVNTATNVISDYQTGAIVLETEGDGSKFLSDDGSYKTIEDKIVIIKTDLNTDETLASVKDCITNNKIPFSSNEYNNQKTGSISPILCEIDIDGELVSYSIIDGTKLTRVKLDNNTRTYEEIDLNQIVRVNLSDYIGSTIPQTEKDKLTVTGAEKLILVKPEETGWYSVPAIVSGLNDIIIEYIYKGQYNKVTIDSSNNVTKETKDLGGDLSNYLAKNNTTEFTPTEDYNPATKKYVDENVSKAITSNGEFNLEYSLGNNNYSDIIFYDVYAIKTSNGCMAAMTLYTKGLTRIYDGTYISDSNDSMPNITFNIDVVYNYKDDDNKNMLLNSIIKGNIRINFDINTIDYGLTSITTTCKQITLTESEYSALGNISSDNVLYFVTPD